MLIGPHGIPLGLLVGAFQIGSAEYLISKSYVKPFRHSLFHRHYKMFFVALALGLAILYSFLVGPASAGAIIPVLKWWEMKHPFDNNLPLISYISRSTAELYPMRLEARDINSDCLEDDKWQLQGCPGEGFPTLDDWAYTRVEEGWRYNVTDESEHYNPTMLSSFSGQARREIVTKLVTSKDSSSSAAMTATLHSSILALTDAFWHYVSDNRVGPVNKVRRPKFTISKDTPISVPLVQVQCKSVDYGAARQGDTGEGDPFLSFDTSALSLLGGSDGDSQQTKWIVPDSAWNFTRAWNATNVTFIDISAIKPSSTQDQYQNQNDASPSSLSSSLGILVTTPGWFKSKLANGSRLVSQGSVISPCIIDARWLVADEVTFDPRSADVVGTDFTDWLNSAANLTTTTTTTMTTTSGNNKKKNIDLSRRWKISDPISISSSWAETLNARVSNSTRKLFRGLRFIEFILQESVDGKPSTPPPDSSKTNSCSSSSSSALGSGKKNQTSEGGEGKGAEILLQFNPTSVAGKYFEGVEREISVVLSTIIADWLSRSTFRDTYFRTVISPPLDSPPPISTPNTNPPSSCPSQVGSQRDDPNPNPTPDPNEKYVTTVDLIAQRTSRTYSTVPLSQFTNPDPQNPQITNQTAVVYRVHRYGWGYGLTTSDSDPIWFSVIILLIHVLLVTIYFSYSFIFFFSSSSSSSSSSSLFSFLSPLSSFSFFSRFYKSTDRNENLSRSLNGQGSAKENTKGWTSGSWGSIGELVALAILSPPAEELKNSGAGIYRSRTWMTRLRIREGGGSRSSDSDPGQIELVVGNRNGTVVPGENMLKIGKEYS